MDAFGRCLYNETMRKRGVREAGEKEFAHQ